MCKLCLTKIAISIFIFIFSFLTCTFWNWCALKTKLCIPIEVMFLFVQKFSNSNFIYMYVRELYFLISISSVGRTLVGRTQTVTPVFSKIFHLVELSGKSCPVGPELHSSFDASSPPGCCPQSHEILLIKGMKHWDSGWNAQGSRTFIATAHIAAAAIGWRRSGNKRTGQTQFSTQFASKLSFMPPWSPVYFFSLFFEIPSPIWPNWGFWCHLFLTLRITLV